MNPRKLDTMRQQKPQNFIRTVNWPNYQFCKNTKKAKFKVKKKNLKNAIGS